MIRRVEWGPSTIVPEYDGHYSVSYWFEDDDDEDYYTKEFDNFQKAFEFADRQARYGMTVEITNLKTRQWKCYTASKWYQEIVYGEDKEQLYIDLVPGYWESKYGEEEVEVLIDTSNAHNWTPEEWAHLLAESDEAYDELMTDFNTGDIEHILYNYEDYLKEEGIYDAFCESVNKL